MSRITTGLPLVYRPDKAHVWVEDMLTAQYLQELWQDAGIVFHVGGGNQTIKAVTHDAAAEGLRNVLGMVDRDFGDTNFVQWTNPASGASVMILPGHELENYLLDEDALAGCALNNQRRTVADVAAYTRNTASLCEWQVAAAQVIASWRDTFQADFPSHPSRVAAHDQPSTLALLLLLPWYVAAVTRANAITAPGEPAAALAAAHANVTAWLSSADWKSRFPGKQIFRDVRGYIYDPAAFGAPSTGIQPDIDVAVAVAIWQRSNGRVPTELQTLHAVIHAKAGV